MRVHTTARNSNWHGLFSKAYAFATLFDFRCATFNSTFAGQQTTLRGEKTFPAAQAGKEKRTAERPLGKI